MGWARYRTSVLMAAVLVAGACESAPSGHDSGPAPASTAPSGVAAPSSLPLVAVPGATGGPNLSRGPAPAVTHIEVPSTVDQYFVLYVRPSADDAREIPVSITRGKAGKTALTDRRARLADDRYRVAAFSVAQPGDVDGDGVDDLTELANEPTMNPLNAAAPISFDDGTVVIADRATFEALSYKGEEVTPGSHLAGLEFLKFYLLDLNTDRPRLYFTNTVTYRSHRYFAKALGIPNDGGPQPGEMRGELVYHRNVVAPDGTLGVYRFEFEALDSYPFADVQFAYELLASSLPFLNNNLVYYPMPTLALPRYQREKSLYNNSRVRVLLDADIRDDADFAPLNASVGYGLLRAMSLDERPNPRDVVIYNALPNELSRVAGVITTVPQTPLSHVNLRAVQDRVPNAFVRNALEDPAIAALVGRYVKYTVTFTSFVVEPATLAEVDAFYAASRPTTAQVPTRDLSVRAITPLSKVGFADWDAFGVKAANVATLATFGLPAAEVPDGFAVPFSFYDEFMTANGFYERVRSLLADPQFAADPVVQERALKELRDAIKAAPMPAWMMDALSAAQRAFGDGTSIRCRSSTNNEDLPNFSGAGLYDSKTQHPDEGHLSKCIKQVYASLWNYRAFAERDFHRIDHLATAMGVLLIPSVADETVNGVAVSTDPLYGTTDTFYVNAQLGEDLVTNPEALSIPEELVLGADGSVHVVRRSNLVGEDRLLMTDAEIATLRTTLTMIRDRFAVLYGVRPGDRFAIEIEFKITNDNRLMIKQARPWIFN